MAKDLSGEKEKCQKKRLPVDLSVSVILICLYCVLLPPPPQAAVREGYNDLVEDDSHWDFSVWLVVNHFCLKICCGCL